MFATKGRTAGVLVALFFSLLALFPLSRSVLAAKRKTILTIPEGSVGLIAYGSLMSLASMEETLGHKYAAPVHRVHLLGYERSWTHLRPFNDPAAAGAGKVDASFLRGDERVPFVGALELNIRPKKKGRINAILYLVTEQELLELDKRERSYRRVDVAGKIEEFRFRGGKVYVYEELPMRPGGPSADQGTYILIKEFLDMVTGACDALGKEFRDEFDRTTSPCAFEVVSYKNIKWEKRKMTAIDLREVDRVEVTVLVDNYTDLLLMQGNEFVKRPSVVPPRGFLAEHGFACLIKTVIGSEEHVVLMDVGISGTCLLHNARLLEADLGRVEALVLSHGHFDHCGGLAEVVPKLVKGVPVILHPDALLPRRINLPALNRLAPMPPPEEKALRDAGMDIRKVREDSTAAAGCLLVLGEIGRLTEFEKGMPGAEAEIEGRWVKDPFLDDRGVVVKVKGKGLVVVSGCAHAGIINTLRHAQKVTGTAKIQAVLGGFHLTGPMMEPVIGPTIEEMKRIGPAFVVPTHCTGWKAIDQFATEMRTQFVLNTVGTTYVF